MAYLSLEDSNDERDEGAITQGAEDQGLAEDEPGARPSSDKDGEEARGFEGGGAWPSSVDHNENPGLFGLSGLLSVPKVTALLFLVWAAQVGKRLNVCT